MPRCRSSSKDLPKEQAELVKDIVPAQISVSGIQRVLQLLLAERVSIRDLPTILEGIADGVAFTRNPALPRRACARAARAPDLRAVHLADRLPAAHRAVGQAGSRPLPSRSSARARTTPRHAALAAAPSSSRWCASASRTRRARAKRPVLVTSPRHPAVRARDRRALPLADPRAVAGGNPSARAAEDRGRDLGPFRPSPG